MLQTASYDLFVSYADADRAWVEGYLLDALEQAGVRVYSEAAFELGAPRLLEFERAVRQSRRTLLVISPAYLADSFGQFIDLMAGTYGLETSTWPVIPLILQPVALPVRLAMLQSLDATDSDIWPVALARLCAEAQRPVPQAMPVPECPYPGMAPFREADAARFFGREQEVHVLVERLRLHSFITVIGPSGSGKSSLVFAGLLPALRKSHLFGPGDWLTRSLRPGEQPLAALASALAPRQRPAKPALADQDGLLSALLANQPAGDRKLSDNGIGQAAAPSIAEDPAAAVDTLLAATPEAHRLLLFVDQFEEAFTVARSDATVFQHMLLRLAEHPKCYVVLTVRADFYPDLMISPIWPKVQAHRMEVVPLNDDGLREAIVQPAEHVGAFVEAALVERLVADAAGEPGALPLVQETLVLLWERLERRFLPLRAYTALVLPRSAYNHGEHGEHSGLQIAMARRANAAVADLTHEQQAIARRIFLRLIQFGEGRADTRRQQPVSALRAAGDDPLLFETTLRHLADNRLLTLSGQADEGSRKVDIAHEALITGWPMLQGWLRDRREAEQIRRRLEDKAAEWERMGRGSGGLLDDVELLEAERWLAGPDAADLGYDDLLAELAQASRSAIEQAEKTRAAAQQRELAQARALAQVERRARRRLQALAAVLAGLALLAGGFLVWPYALSFIARGEMVTIPAGPVVIGSVSTGAYPEEQPQWPTTLPAFEIERYEVSNRQYGMCVTVRLCSQPVDPIRFSDAALGDHPVVGVTAIQAAEYCHWVGRRLPTELEWERAARGKAPGRQWPWGDVALTAEYANVAIDGKTLDTQPITAFPKGVSPEGVYNLIGNVWEWTSSFKQDTYAGYNSQHIWDEKDLSILKTYNLVYRGGGWEDALERLTQRPDLPGSLARPSLGIRCASNK